MSRTRAEISAPELYLTVLDPLNRRFQRIPPPASFLIRRLRRHPSTQAVGALAWQTVSPEVPWAERPGFPRQASGLRDSRNSDFVRNRA